MEPFTERLARLADMSAEELDALEAELVAAFDAADEAGDVDTMQGIADALDQVRAEKAKRPEGGGEEAAPAAEVPAAPAEVAATAGEPSPPPPAEPTEEPTPVEGEPEPITEPSAETPEGAEPTGVDVDVNVDASDTQTTSEGEDAKEEDTVAEVTRDEVPDRNKPTVTSTASPVVIRAGGDIPGITAGTELADMDAVVEAITRKVNTMRGISGDGEYIVVASMRSEDEIPEDHVLRPRRRRRQQPQDQGTHLRPRRPNPRSLDRRRLVCAQGSHLRRAHDRDREPPSAGRPPHLLR